MIMIRRFSNVNVNWGKVVGDYYRSNLYLSIVIKYYRKFHIIFSKSHCW